MSKEYNSVNQFEQITLPKYYCLVQMHEDLSVEDEFDRESWPHHTTLAGVFSMNSMVALDDIEEITKRALPFDSVVTGYDTFGYNEERVRVALLEKTRQLLALSDNLVDTLHKHGSSFKKPTFLGDAYNPHISDHGGLAGFAIGVIVRFDQLSLVDLAPDGDKAYRRIAWQSPREDSTS